VTSALDISKKAARGRNSNRDRAGFRHARSTGIRRQIPNRKWPYIGGRRRQQASNTGQFP